MPKKQLSAETVDLSSIHLDPKNANVGTKRGSDLVEDSIRTFGFIDPGILDRDNFLIGGNKRTAAAQEVGLNENAIIIDHDGESPIYIRYKEFDLDSPDADIRERSRRLAYMLNRSAQVSLKWDAVQLEDDISAGLDLSALFDEKELEQLIIRAKAIPNTPDQSEPTLVAEHIVQIYCSADDLETFMPTLNEWMEKQNVIINIA